MNPPFQERQVARERVEGTSQPPLVQFPGPATWRILVALAFAAVILSTSPPARSEPVGANLEFRLRDATSVDMNADGQIAMAWVSRDSRLYFETLTSSGIPVIRLLTLGRARAVFDPKIGIDDGGAVVLAWERDDGRRTVTRYNPSGFQAYSIPAPGITFGELQLDVAPDGTAVTAALAPGEDVGSTTISLSWLNDTGVRTTLSTDADVSLLAELCVAVGPDGAAAVTWTDPTDESLWFQVVNENGVHRNPPTQVSAPGATALDPSVVWDSGGSIAIAYTLQLTPGAESIPGLRIYDSMGVPMNSVASVGDPRVAVRDVAVVSESTDSLVVFWREGYAVVATQLATSGSPSCEDYVVAIGAPSVAEIERYLVAGNSSGSFVVTWQQSPNLTAQVFSGPCGVALGSFASWVHRTPQLENADDAVAWRDLDLDGDPDAMIFGPDGSRLLRNDAGVLNEDTPLGLSTLTEGGAWADTDNDGDADLFAGGFYRNDGGSFVQHSSPAIDALADLTGPRWADYDRDGNLDVFLAGSGRLLRNVGANQFEDATPPVLAGQPPPLAAVWSDYDDDGDADLLLCRGENEANSLLRNDGAAGFVDVATATLAQPERVTLAASFADMDGDLDLDLVLLTQSRACPDESCSWTSMDLILYQEASGDFEVGRTFQIGAAASLAIGDFDNDGDQDLFRFRLGSPTTRRLIRNEGNSVFSDQTHLMGLNWAAASAGGWVDANRDGLLDLYGVSDGLNAYFVRYEIPDDNWLRVRLQGEESNRDGVGARIIVETASGAMLREVTSPASSRAQMPLVQHFGLGVHAEALSVTVRWPSGIQTVVRDVTGGQEILVEEHESVSVAVPKMIASATTTGAEIEGTLLASDSVTDLGIVRQDGHAPVRLDVPVRRAGATFRAIDDTGPTTVDTRYWLEWSTPSGTQRHGPVAVELDPTGETRVRLTAGPSPFATQTLISLALPKPSTVEISIYDVMGRRVLTLHRGELPAGRSQFPWQGLDQNGRPVAQGLYLVRATTPNQRAVRRVLLLR